jgi:hypothetical protein
MLRGFRRWHMAREMSGGDEAAAANLDDGDARSDLDQRRQDERHRPGCGTDLAVEALEGLVDASVSS